MLDARDVSDSHVLHRQQKRQRRRTESASDIDDQSVRSDDVGTLDIDALSGSYIFVLYVHRLDPPRRSILSNHVSETNGISKVLQTFFLVLRISYSTFDRLGWISSTIS